MKNISDSLTIVLWSLALVLILVCLTLVGSLFREKEWQPDQML